MGEWGRARCHWVRSWARAAGGRELAAWVLVRGRQSPPRPPPRSSPAALSWGRRHAGRGHPVRRMSVPSGHRLALASIIRAAPFVPWKVRTSWIVDALLLLRERFAVRLPFGCYEAPWGRWVPSPSPRGTCGARAAQRRGFHGPTTRASVGGGVETQTRPRALGPAHRPAVLRAPHTAPLCRRRGPRLAQRPTAVRSSWRRYLGHTFKFSSVKPVCDEIVQRLLIRQSLDLSKDRFLLTFARPVVFNVEVFSISRRGGGDSFGCRP